MTIPILQRCWEMGAAKKLGTRANEVTDAGGAFRQVVVFRLQRTLRGCGLGEDPKTGAAGRGCSCTSRPLAVSAPAAPCAGLAGTRLPLPRTSESPLHFYLKTNILMHVSFKMFAHYTTKEITGGLRPAVPTAAAVCFWKQTHAQPVRSARA